MRDDVYLSFGGFACGVVTYALFADGFLWLGVVLFLVSIVGLAAFIIMRSIARETAAFDGIPPLAKTATLTNMFDLNYRGDHVMVAARNTKELNLLADISKQYGVIEEKGPLKFSLRAVTHPARDIVELLRNDYLEKMTELGLYEGPIAPIA